MAKIVVSRLKLSSDKSVKTKRVRTVGVHGSKVFRIVDGESPTLASDLTHVFRANVARARAANAALGILSSGAFVFALNAATAAKKTKILSKKPRSNKRKIAAK